MTDRLEPCPTPWCEPEHEKYTWQGPDDLFCVICDGCQVEGPHCENEGDAQDAWNNRTPSLAAQDGLVDALRIARVYVQNVVDAEVKAFNAKDLAQIDAALASIEVKS